MSEQQCVQCTWDGVKLVRMCSHHAEIDRLQQRLDAADDLIAHLRISEAGYLAEYQQAKERLAAATAAARFYARYYDGPAESLLGEEDRKAFQWVELNRGEP